MGRKTGKITFNVRERGRSYVGSDRNYDMRALQALVMSGAVQERVKNRDLTGYYGHIIRMKFGIQPPEFVIVEGKTINIEPAVVTTFLEADGEGNITHETEFLDTVPGAIAERLFNSRTGGFSSAIFAVPRGPIDVPTIFAGFDYVFEPNFTTNRGYMLDSTGDMMAGLMLDAVTSEWNHSASAYKAIYDSLDRDHSMALQTIETLRLENEELMSLMVRAGRAGNDTGIVMFDSTGGEQSKPFTVSKRPNDAFKARARSFANAQLVAFAPEDGEKDAVDDAVLAAAHRQYGVA